MDILTLFACFETLTGPVATRQLAVIAGAMLSMTGRITMLSLSRWTDKSGSYRSLNRFFVTKLAWTELFVNFFRTHLFNERHEYLVAGDETVIGKAGQETFGLDRFYSGLKGSVIKGLSFFVLSLVDVTEERSYPLSVNQTVRSEEEQAALRERKKKRLQKTQKKNRRRGRPKGSLNKKREEGSPSPEILRIDEALKGLLKLLGLFVTVGYLALDGHFGHEQAVLMAQAYGLQLISKLRCDAALFEEYEDRKSGRGRKKKYGAKLDYQKIDPKYLKKSERVGQLVTNYYQGLFLSKSLSGRLNVVIIERINLQRGKAGHSVLFSSDEELAWEKLIKYYSLRFQIEFNFRDAKQHFGLEDFMNRTPTGVENAANLSFLMINLSAKLLTERADGCQGINDLKSRYRGLKYALETIKILEPKVEGILIEKVKQMIGRIGSIHQPRVSNLYP